MITRLVDIGHKIFLVNRNRTPITQNKNPGDNK